MDAVREINSALDSDSGKAVERSSTEQPRAAVPT
jgi:hypothetical protein